jgi:cytochrome P450
METIEYNPFAPGFAEDPYEQYARLRAEGPVQQTPFGIWALFRYEDVIRFLRDTSLSVEQANAHETGFDALRAEAGVDERVGPTESMLNRDPPDHTRLRRLVSKAFTPRTIQQLQPRIVELVDAALDRAAERGSIELISDLAFPLPFQVITEMMGMPEVDTDQLRAWTALLVRGLEPVVDPDTMRAMAQASDDFEALLTDAIAWKRSNPGDDLFTRLIQAEEGGDSLSDTELIAQVALLYVAGHETTVNLIGNGGLALVRNPDEVVRWRNDPDLDANAIDELLRYDSPVQNTRRITRSEVSVGGRTIEPGAFVALSLASSNRDEAQWGPTAGRLDLTRPRSADHLSFGGGHHFCLGAALARLEGQTALGRLVRRFPTIELVEEPTWNGRLNLRGLTALDLAVAGA